MSKQDKLRIGFVSTRLEGTDGVSLEAFKWAKVLAEFGHECFYFAGACDQPADRSRVVPPAHFQHALIQQINQDLFDDHRRSRATTDAIHDVWRTLEESLREFVADFAIDVLIVENALSLPMNVPLGMALTSLIVEANIPTIAHHHDFIWERPRYNIHAAGDFLHAAFPPVMPHIHNVVINSYAATQLARRTGMRSTVIPNVMDFENPPSEPDEFAKTLRLELGLSNDELLLLQPTRVVPRKRIERSVELAARLERPCTLVVTHSSNDEGHEYKIYLEELARRFGIKVVFSSEKFAFHRHNTDKGNRVFSLSDAYQQADLVTYPSIVEGFGNAFLEAIYFRRPLVMCHYEIFQADIKPKGFEVIEFGEFTTQQTVAEVRDLLPDSQRVSDMTDRNYDLGLRHFSFTSLRRRLHMLIDHLFGRLY